MPADAEEAGLAYVRRLGRLCLAIIFIAGGWDATRSPGARSAKVVMLGLPKPELLERANGATKVVAGIVMALGRYSRAAAAVLASVLLPTTFVGHPFCQEAECLNSPTEHWFSLNGCVSKPLAWTLLTADLRHYRVPERIAPDARECPQMCGLTLVHSTIC